MFPCHGRIIRSLSSDDEDDTESSSDSDLSTDLPSRAATIMQNSNDPPIRSGSRFCFTLTRAQSLRSSTDPSTDGNHDYDELMAGNTVRINDLPSENFERRPSRRNGFQDPFEGSVRFSRTLSVGRLRDRVLRRSSILDGSHEISDILGRRALNRAMRGAIEGNTPDDYHQSTILERRRRLRSQVCYITNICLWTFVFTWQMYTKFCLSSVGSCIPYWAYYFVRVCVSIKIAFPLLLFSIVISDSYRYGLFKD